MLKLKKFSRYYGYKKVIDSIDFELQENEIKCILGPNGAGKTTLLEGILSHQRHLESKIFFYNKEIKTINEHYQFLKEVSYLGHEPGLFLDLTLLENLKFIIDLYKPSGKDVYYLDEILFLIEKIGLYNRRNDIVKNYSRGMKQRAGLLRCIITKPKILLLDEPTTSLDQKGKVFLMEFLQEFKKQGSSLIVTHEDNIFYTVTNKFVFLNQGKIMAEIPKEKYTIQTKENIQQTVL